MLEPQRWQEAGPGRLGRCDECDMIRGCRRVDDPYEWAFNQKTVRRSLCLTCYNHLCDKE